MNRPATCQKKLGRKKTSEQSKQLDSPPKVTAPIWRYLQNYLIDGAVRGNNPGLRQGAFFPRDLLMHGVSFMGAAVNVKAFVEMRRRGLS